MLMRNIGLSFSFLVIYLSVLRSGLRWPCAVSGKCSLFLYSLEEFMLDQYYFLLKYLVGLTSEDTDNI